MRIARGALCAGALVLLGTAAGAKTIYRCESAAGMVFSDRPCAVDAAVHAADGSRVSVYKAPPTAVIGSTKRASEPRSKPAAARSAMQRAAAAEAKRKAACARLEQSLRDVRSKLRTGYGAKEGERLKTRQRQLAERRRAENCR